MKVALMYLYSIMVKAYGLKNVSLLFPSSLYQLITRVIFLSRGFRSASGYLGSVSCLAIIRRFILWRVSDEKVLSGCWKHVSAFLCYSKVLQYKASVQPELVKRMDSNYRPEQGSYVQVGFRFHARFESLWGVSATY